MTYKPITKGKVINWIWAAVVFGAFAVALMWFIWDPFAGKTRVAPQPEAVPSSQWTTAPDGERVQVDLPETPVRVAPQDEAAGQSRNPDGQ